MKAPLIAVLLALPASAMETASFLDIGAGARAQGMGGAATALSDDSEAVYWNPAGLARLEKKHVSLSHAELGAGNRHNFLAYAHPTSKAVFAGGFTYLSYGTIDGRNSLGQRTGNYEASDAAAHFAVGMKTEWGDVGGSLKYVRSHIASQEAQGVAFDAGLRRAWDAAGGKLTAGAALRNMGPGLKYQDQRNDLPLRAAFGAAFKFAKGHAVAAEFQNGPRGSGSEGGAGGELQAMEGVLLRLGWTSKSAAANGAGFDAARGLTLGLGLRRGGFGLDYAAQAAGELGSTHRFTLGAKF